MGRREGLYIYIYYKPQARRQPEARPHRLHGWRGKPDATVGAAVAKCAAVDHGAVRPSAAAQAPTAAGQATAARVAPLLATGGAAAQPELIRPVAPPQLQELRLDLAQGAAAAAALAASGTALAAGAVALSGGGGVVARAAARWPTRRRRGAQEVHRPGHLAEREPQEQVLRSVLELQAHLRRGEPWSSGPSIASVTVRTPDVSTCTSTCT